MEYLLVIEYASYFTLQSLTAESNYMYNTENPVSMSIETLHAKLVVSFSIVIGFQHLTMYKVTAAEAI